MGTGNLPRRSDTAHLATATSSRALSLPTAAEKTPRVRQFACSADFRTMNWPPPLGMKPGCAQTPRLAYACSNVS